MMGTGRGKKRSNATEPSIDSNNAKRRKISHHSHASDQGHVLTLGQGDTGQLGLGPDVMERTKPGKVDLPPEVVQVCAGGMHTVCLTANGEVYTFGCNDEGALGRKTADEDDCMVPGKVKLDHKLVQVCAGDSHTAALTHDGQVFAWGTFRDPNGSIGLTQSGKSEVPIEVFPNHTAMKISSGSDHLVILTSEKDIYTLGCAEQGQLGRVAECFSHRGGRKGLGSVLSPSKVYCRRKKTRFTDIWTGQYVTFARTDGNEVYAWGLNNYYQLGFSDMKNRFVPEKSTSFNVDTNWKEISSGQHHTLALDSSGKVYSLGRKEYGRLGLGEDPEEKKAPTLIPSLADKKCVHISCGTAVSFAVESTGKIYGWGMGTNKQLGQADEDDVYEPVELTGKQLQNRKGLFVSAGGQHAVILAQDKPS